MAYSLFKSGALKPHFYNTVLGKPELQHFHQLYCEYKRHYSSFYTVQYIHVRLIICFCQPIKNVRFFFFSLLDKYKMIKSGLLMLSDKSP